MTRVRAFVQGRVCLGGKQVEKSLYVDTDTGLLIEKPQGPVSEQVDLKGCFLAPALLELQINGAIGFHFTKFVDARSYQENLSRVSKHLLKSGVGAFYVTLPTVSPDVLEKVYLKFLSLQSVIESREALFYDIFAQFTFRDKWQCSRNISTFVKCPIFSQ